MHMIASSRATFSGRNPMRGVIALAGLLVVACTRTNVADSTAALPKAPPNASAVPASAVTNNPTGTLEKSLAWYVTQPDSFAKFTDSLKWTGHYYDRECKSNCGGKKAKLLLEAISDAHLVDMDNLPVNGVLMARMINVGTKPEKTYDIPEESGEWFMLVYGTSTDRRFDLVQLIFDAVGAPHVYPRGLGAFAQIKRCEPEADHPQRTKASAGFSGCDKKPDGWDRAGFAANKNVWVSCSLGCCSSEYPAFTKTLGDSLDLQPARPATP
jgi:hypothetical protein